MNNAQTPKAPRAMAALMVLAEDLPMPVRIVFQGEGIGETGRSIISLSFRTVVEGQAWSRHLGGRIDTHVSAETGVIWLDEGVIEWHGWSVLLHASDDPPNPGCSLNENTITQLATIAGGDRRGQHA